MLTTIKELIKQINALGNKALINNHKLNTEKSDTASVEIWFLLQSINKL